MKLILWSKSAKEFLHELQNLDDIILFSDSELKDELDKGKIYSTILLQTELVWEGHYLQDFYGFDIALELRTKYKQKCPIILFSCLSPDIFEGLALKTVKYNILYGRGTAFVELSNCERQLVEEIIAETELLSNATLTDVSEMLCNLKGLVVDKLTHDLKWEVNETDIRQTLKAVEQYLSTEQLARVTYLDFTKSLLLSKSNNDFETFIKTKNAFISLCASELVNSGGDGKPKQIFKNKYKILVLEDDVEFLNLVREKFDKHFEVVAKSDANKAIDILNDDVKNEITAIVSDWRLYIDSTKYWQKQGYEVLEYAAKHRHIALFSLTSEDDFNVHNIRNMLGLDIYLIKKQTLHFQSNWDTLIERILYGCEQISTLISSLPTGGNWKTDTIDKKSYFTPLNKQYISKRNYSEWLSFEHHISEESDRIWKYYSQMLGEDLSQTTVVTNWTDKFGISFSKSSPNLQTILIARRIFLALWFNSERLSLNIERTVKDSNTYRVTGASQVTKIRLVTYGETWIEDYWEKQENEEKAYKSLETAANSLATNVCIIPSKLPYGILPEEKAWLLKHNIDSSKNCTPDLEEYEREGSENDNIESYLKKQESSKGKDLFIVPYTLGDELED